MTTEQKQQPAEVMGLTLAMLLEAANGPDAALTTLCARARAVQDALTFADQHATMHLNECRRACGKNLFRADDTAEALGITDAELAHRRTILAGASQAQHDLRMQVIALEEMRREFGRLTALTW
jgi:hypothetical protein